jgi:diacylglycerol kinase family enzyme
MENWSAVTAQDRGNDSELMGNMDHTPEEKRPHHLPASEAMSSPVCVILNALAGAPAKAHDALCQRLLDLFQSQGIHPCVSLASSGTEVSSLARRAVRDRYQRIVAGGGDGTINAVAAALVGTDVALGVLPLGTLNHFAKDLGIPLDLEGAVHTISAGYTVRVDVGEVNGHVFLNNSSLGLYPRIVRHRKKQQERLGRGKWPAFVWAALTMLRRYPFLHLRLCLEGEELARRTPFVFIGNNIYQLDIFNVGVRACLDAGALSLYVPHRTGRLGLCALALRALLGRLRRTKDFDTLCVQELRIDTRPTRLLVATDGEVRVMETPLHYRIRPGALRVIVPCHL